MVKELVFIVNSDKQAMWNERIEEFLTSGQSRRAWCQANGMSAQQLGYWLRKSQSSEERSASDRWVSMEATSSASSGITLRIGDVTLDVERGFDPRVLTDVVLALMAIC